MKTMKWHIAPRDGEGLPWVYLEVWEFGRCVGKVGSSLDQSLSTESVASTMASIARNMGVPYESFAETARIGGVMPTVPPAATVKYTATPLPSS